MSNAIRRIVVKSECSCSKDQIFLELDFPLELKYLSQLQTSGYNSSNSYASTGILYLDNNSIIAIGAVGANRFEVKCKGKDCDADITAFEETLKDLQTDAKGSTP